MFAIVPQVFRTETATLQIPIDVSLKNPWLCVDQGKYYSYIKSTLEEI